MSKIKVLGIMDFDGTLVNTPAPDSVVNGTPAIELYDRWLKERGEPKRKFRGWWGRIESLIPPVFGTWNENDKIVSWSVPAQALNNDLARLSNKMTQNPEVISVLMTGRHRKMFFPETRDHICRVILDKYGVYFNRYYFLDDSRTTFEFKQSKILDLLKEFPTIECVEIWEDRDKHVTLFRDFMISLTKKKRFRDFSIHRVREFERSQKCTTVSTKSSAC